MPWPTCLRGTKVLDAVFFLRRNTWGEDRWGAGLRCGGGGGGERARVGDGRGGGKGSK